MTVRIPAKHVLAVAAAILDAEQRTVDPENLEVIVDEGQMELVDSGGTYGVRKWA